MWPACVESRSANTGRRGRARCPDRPLAGRQQHAGVPIPPVARTTIRARTTNREPSSRRTTTPSTRRLPGSTSSSMTRECGNSCHVAGATEPGPAVVERGAGRTGRRRSRRWCRRAAGADRVVRPFGGVGAVGREAADHVGAPVVGVELLPVDRPAGQALTALEVDRVERADGPSVVDHLRVSERAADGPDPRAVERGERIALVPGPALAPDPRSTSSPPLSSRQTLRPEPSSSRAMVSPAGPAPTMHRSVSTSTSSLRDLRPPRGAPGTGSH